MPSDATPISHRVIAANVHAVPAPFRSFAARSDEPQHASDARAPYGWVHIVRTAFLDAPSLTRLAATGDARCSIDAFSDIDYATTTLPELAAAVPHVSDLAGHIASALQLTGVLGSSLADYRRSVATRIDYLAARGAGFHNDVSRHWSRCLFWLLVLDLSEVDFVMPHAGVCATSVAALVRTRANTCHHPNTTGNQRAAPTTARYLCNATAMKMIIPANSEAKALLILPGTSEAVDANVIAWEFDEHRPSPPRPIVAPDLPGARVAVCINAVQLFEWPGTVHANREAFLA